MKLLALCALVSAQAAGARTVGYWRFEEGQGNHAASGNWTVTDSSGRGNHGTPLGAPIYRSRVGGSPGNLALEFDGVDDSVSVRDSSLFELTGSLTLEAFVTIHRFSPQNTSTNYIVIRGDSRSGLDPYYLFYHSDGRIGFKITNAAGENAIVWSGQVPVQESFHVAGTLNGETGVMALYIQHRLANRIVTAIRPLGPLLVDRSPGIGIGNTPNNTHREHFDGLIDEVRISDAALSIPEFLQPRSLYGDWAASQGFNPDASGPTHDLNGDGFPNLLHLALGVPVGANIPTEHPDRVPHVEPNLFPDRAAIVFRVPQTQLDALRISMEESLDGQSWRTIASRDGNGAWVAQLPNLLSIAPVSPEWHVVKGGLR